MSLITGTYHLTKQNGRITKIRAKIQRRRLQILVHSCIYYKFNDNIVSDRQWDKWAYDLVRLQHEYPKISEHVGYHKYFKNFDGTTGYDLPFHRPEIINKAKYLLRLNRKKVKK